MKKEEEKEEEGEDKMEGEDKKEGEEDNNDEVWGDSDELCNCVRLQGAEELSENEPSFEICENEATLIGINEEEDKTRTNIFDEQFGQICDSEADAAEKKETSEKEREENSQLLKDIGMQVIKPNKIIALHNFGNFTTKAISISISICQYNISYSMLLFFFQSLQQTSWI